MTTLADITAEYKTRNEALQKVDDRIEMRKAQIERLEKKRDRAREKAHWMGMVHEIMNIVAEKTPHVIWELNDKRSACGLRCEYYLFGKTTQDEITVGICFTPGRGGVVRFDTGEKTSRFASGTIGSMNGFDNVSKPLEDIQELLDLVETKIQEEKDIRNESHIAFMAEFKSGDNVVIGRSELGVLESFEEPGFCMVNIEGESKRLRVYKMRSATAEEIERGWVKTW